MGVKGRGGFEAVLDINTNALHAQSSVRLILCTTSSSLSGQRGRRDGCAWDWRDAHAMQCDRLPAFQLQNGNVQVVINQVVEKYVLLYDSLSCNREQTRTSQTPSIGVTFWMPPLNTTLLKSGSL